MEAAAVAPSLNKQAQITEEVVAGGLDVVHPQTTTEWRLLGKLTSASNDCLWALLKADAHRDAPDSNVCSDIRLRLVRQSVEGDRDVTLPRQVVEINRGMNEALVTDAVSFELLVRPIPDSLDQLLAIKGAFPSQHYALAPTKSRKSTSCSSQADWSAVTMNVPPYDQLK